MRAIDLLLVAAMGILFFMGFVVGFVLPPNVTGRIERVGDQGEVRIQHLRIRPTADIVHATIGKAHVAYVGTPSAHRYLRGEAEAADIVCERLPRSGTLCYLYESPAVSIHPRLLRDRRRSPGPVPVGGYDHLLLGERSYARKEVTHQNR
jgi:hypothetical protein